MFTVLGFNINITNILFWAIAAGLGIIILVFLYYYLQYRLVKSKVQTAEHLTGNRFHIPFFGAPSWFNNAKEYARAQNTAENRATLHRYGKQGYTKARAYQHQNILHAPDDLRQQYSEAPGREAPRNIKDATLRERIEQAKRGDTAFVKESEFKPTHDKIHLEKVTAVYKPGLDAPKNFLHKLLAPASNYPFHLNPAHKGRLRHYVEREYGKDGFDTKGRIKKSVLEELEYSPDKHLRKEAGFALNARSFDHRHQRHTLAAPKADINNLGKGKGSIVYATDLSTDPVNEVIANLPTQLRTAHAESMEDGSIRVVGMTANNKKYELIGTSHTNLEKQLQEKKTN